MDERTGGRGAAKTRAVVAALIGATLVAAACSSTGEVDLESTGASSDVVDPAGVPTDPSPTTAAPPTTTTSVPTRAETTSTTTTIAVKSPVSTSTTPVASLPYADFDTSVLGPYGRSDRLLVRLDPPADPDNECPPGRLGVQDGDEIVHVYDELGEVGGLTYHPTVDGVTAVVENCEEFISRIFFLHTDEQRGTFDPPTVVVATPPDDVFWMRDIGFWALTGEFMAEAAFVDFEHHWTEVVVFDTDDGEMHRWADVLGWRTGQWTAGVDFVVPWDWDLEPLTPEDSVISMSDPRSPARVDITVVPWEVVEEPIEEGDVLRDRYSWDEDLWFYVGEDDRAQPVGEVMVTEYYFTAPEGERIVRVVPMEDRSIVIEAFVVETDDPVADNVPIMVMELVRVVNRADAPGT